MMLVGVACGCFAFGVLVGLVAVKAWREIDEEMLKEESRH